VPNHLTEQWASDFLRLYPGANILAATKKVFEPANRKKFCSRIATGDYDAVINVHDLVILSLVQTTIISG
jgi:N12 class adenine-specific DNA methylase